MNRPLEIRDVENISLEASDDNSDMYPQLVAQFSCQHETNSDCISYSFGLKFVCCSVVLMINVTYAAIEGISVTVTTPHVSGVVLQQCSHLHIQSNTYIGIQAERDVLSSVGITAYESSDIEMDSLEASNFTFGVALSKSRNTSMINVSAVHNGYDGIWLDNSTDTSMMNVSAAHNGIWLYRCTNTSMMNVSAVHNGWYGIRLHHSTDTSMMNVSAVHNRWDGIYLDYSTDTSMMNVSAAHNEHVGIYLDHSTDTSMVNVSAVHNEVYGILLVRATNTSMMNVSAAHNQNRAIMMSACVNTSLYYSYTYHNHGDGIYIDECRTTHILYYNTKNTMHNVIINSTDTYILNSVLSEHSDIEMRNTAKIYITNTTSLITAYNTINIVLNDTLFSDMDAPSTASSTSSQPAYQQSFLSITPL